MRNIVIAAALIFAACGGTEQPAATDSTDTRMPLAIEYVTASEAKIHAAAGDASPVISTYGNGETVSVLARKDGWAEVRTATGSGWAHAADLGSSQAAASQADNLTPRFRKAPAPITQTSVHGEIVFEADVSPDGEVLAVRTTANTTGSMALEVKNGAELKSAKFYPIVQHGRRVPFTYEYRVHY